MKKILLFCALGLFLTNCSQLQFQHIEGSAFGTYYAITYKGKAKPDLQAGVDSILRMVNSQFSVFDSSSLVSRINNNQDFTLTEDFITVFNKAQFIAQETNGAFDMTIGPLVDIWGFGRSKRQENISQECIDSILTCIGYDKIHITDGQLVKNDIRIQLNFNALAKGYAVDKVAEYLVSQGYNDVLVDIGGEIVAKGKKYPDEEWNIGIQTPTISRDGEMRSEQSFHLFNKAVATSGNYRNYFEEDGIRYTHIIDPTTGRPEKSTLLSVSVIMEDCMSADAYATAFMVMGKTKTMNFLLKHPEITCYFISGENGDYKVEKYQTMKK